MLLFLFGVVVLNFEKRKPRAREIALLSTMTGLSVAANELCSHTIPLHAGTAMVVISGIALGPETGFFVGALARFVCNFFSGQGPWTPWQMFSWGLMGYLAGLCFNTIRVRGRLEEETLAGRFSLKKNTSFRLLAGPLAAIAGGEDTGISSVCVDRSAGRDILGLACVCVWFFGTCFRHSASKEKTAGRSGDNFGVCFSYYGTCVRGNHEFCGDAYDGPIRRGGKCGGSEGVVCDRPSL